jgi:hydroxymethylbilane synthase
MRTFTVATRGGELAIAQTNAVISELKKLNPDIQIKIKKITTRGDRDRRTTLWKLRTSGFFTSQVEDALLAGQADFAVHSFKDLPTKQQDGLTIAAVCKREFAEDCIVTAGKINSIDELSPKARIGTSSLRRAVQIKHIRKDLEPVPIRGNVTTRVRLVEDGKFDAIVLARAGMERLGWGEKISFCFEPEQFIPAPAQGALAVQTKSDDIATNQLVASLNDEKTRIATFAERQILVTTECGCHAPVGAFAKIIGDDVIIYAFISDAEGENFIRREIAGPVTEADELAKRLANELLEAGGKEILERIENGG